MLRFTSTPSRGRPSNTQQNNSSYPSTSRARANAPYNPPRACTPQGTVVSRPGILKKPKPQALQNIENIPNQQRPPLPVWRSTAPNTQTAPRTQRVQFSDTVLVQSKPSIEGKTTPSSDPGKDRVALTVGPSQVRTVEGIAELFGTLDSKVTSYRQGSAKQFTLRHERSSVTCVFYQMDRALPPLRQGQWVRCVGTLNAVGQFLAVSVRPATDEEKKYMNGLLNISNLATAAEM